MKTTLRSLLAAVLCTCSVSAPAAAQTGPELMLLPWQEGQTAQVSGRVSTQDTETDRVNFDLDLTRFVGSGRFRFSPDSDDSPAVGFRYTHLDLNTSDPALPSRLVDFSIAFGGQIGTTDFGCDCGDWRVGYTVGVGYAGDVPFHDGDAWYALGSLFAVQAIDRDTQWIVALQYDGNRTFLPDIPLPSVTYRARYNEQLTYALGFPFSSLNWKPNDRWTVLLRTALFISVTARVEYTPAEGLVIYGAYEREVDAFQLDGDDSSRRLIFSQQRLEAGVRYTIYDNTTLTAAVGYAFAQEFERGYDTRDTRTVRDLDDAVYVRVGVEVGF
ncbi:hypothetical protein OT109_08280 [Phycisphaeraceae bacterium D3-23]